MGTAADPGAAADSFAISDSLATAYLATEVRPMWHVTLEGQARIVQDHFVALPSRRTVTRTVFG